MDRVFTQIWDQLRAKKAQLPEFLEGVDIKNFRGIRDLSVRFEFPVTVIAGPNGCGKSTVLFTCASGYLIPDANSSSFSPGYIFPNLKAKGSIELSDKQQATSFDYHYIHKGKRTDMIWKRARNWNRSFGGKQGGQQPVRSIYLRTLANLTSPSEVRSFLSIGSSAYANEQITSDLIAFAHRILPQQYTDVKQISKGDKSLLFVQRGDATANYSEFHMSAGERAILRISKDISNLKDALILIDEIEAGLHPYTQQQFMLELQRLALRNNLQIIVTSHSPVVLETVPVEARVFLERTKDNVIIQTAFRDIIQKAFYGQSLEKLSVLCEDNMGEAFLSGVMDVLNPKLRLMPDDIVIGRDTGKDMFATHIQAIGKFKQLDNFIFALDGDARNLENQLKIAAQKFGKSIEPLFLPGDVPESWIWQILKDNTSEYATEIGVNVDDLIQRISQLDQQFNGAVDKPTAIMKNKYFTFCESMRLNQTDLMRKIARKEAEKQSADIKIFMDNLEILLRNWQARTQ